MGHSGLVDDFYFPTNSQHSIGSEEIGRFREDGHRPVGHNGRWGGRGD